MIDRAFFGHVGGAHCVGVSIVILGQVGALAVILFAAAIFIIEAKSMADLMLMGVVRGHGGEVKELQRVGFIHLVKAVRQELGGKADRQVIAFAELVFHRTELVVIMALHPQAKLKDAGDGPVFLGDADKVAVHPAQRFGFDQLAGFVCPVERHIGLYTKAIFGRTLLAILIFDLTEADMLVALVAFIKRLAVIVLFLAGEVGAGRAMGRQDRFRV